MSMVCPQCNTLYENQERVCPTCSIQLLFYARMAPAAAVNLPVEEDTGTWQKTAWGRILVGLILAQGLALGLKQLLTAGFLASREDVSSHVWDTMTGVALLHSLHALGLLAGGALAGAGQRHGVLYGGIVGLGSGALFLALQPVNDRMIAEGTYFAQPLLHWALGAMGGWFGRAIWRPTPRLVLPESKLSGLPAPAMFEMNWLHGPIAWFRVIAGATIMTCGIIWAKWIMTWMIDNSQGALSVTTHFQAKLVSGEIAGLTMLVGACLAGSTTWNGMKQGLCVGIGGAVLYIGFQWANPTATLETVVFAIMCMLGLGLIGGWFGSQLFPPIDPLKRRGVAHL